MPLQDLQECKKHTEI